MHRTNSITDQSRLQANNAILALFPINEIRWHAAMTRHYAGDACTLLGVASDLLTRLPVGSDEDHHVYTRIDCLIRAAQRALGEIDEAAASTSLALEDAGIAVEGGAA